MHITNLSAIPTFPPPCFYFPPSFRPMKGFAVDPNPFHRFGLTSIHPHIHPLLLSVKLDGIRFLTLRNEHSGLVEAFSAKLLKLPSSKLQQLASNLPPGIEGEVMLRTSDTWAEFSTLQSVVMSRDGTGDLHFFAFDYWQLRITPFIERYHHLIDTITIAKLPFLHFLHHQEVTSTDQIHALTNEAIANHFEGTILRNTGATYKWGRSTFTERGMLKLKPFVDDEAVVVGFEQFQHNSNTPEQDELGLTKRSSALAGLVPCEKLGALIVVSPEFQASFNIGTGFTDQERIHIWANRSQYLSRQLTFKYQKHGTKHLPRIPVFKHWRDPRA